MTLRCPTCGSKDLWLPRRKKSSFDRFVERFGYKRFDCRGCWRRPILKYDKRKKYQEASPAVPVEADGVVEQATEQAVAPVVAAPELYPEQTLKIPKRATVAEHPKSAEPPKVAPAVSPVAPAVVPPALTMELPSQLTVIGPTVMIQGDVYAEESLRVFGKLEGTLNATGHRLIIEPEGSVSATVKAADIIVRGRLQGDTAASGSITVCRDGRLTGGARTAKLIVEDGAYVKGKNETGTEFKPPTSAETPKPNKREQARSVRISQA